MPESNRARSVMPSLLLAAVLALAPPAARSQVAIDGFVTGPAARAWESWQAAMQAVLARDAVKSEASFGELVAADASPLRLALMGERLLAQGNLAGALILLEQDADAGALGENGKRVFELYRIGVEQLAQADDGFYFSLVGQFAIAAANFRALLRSDPDPVALLEFVDRVPRREEILVLVSDNPLVGEAAREVLALLAAGERKIKADPLRILQHIERLGGPPRQYENSVARLQDSGEYAVPFLIQTLRDPARRDLAAVVLRTLPKIGRPALNPLTAALKVPDQTLKRHLIAALGQIGYFQAVPYLLALRENPATPQEVLESVQTALVELSQRGVAVSADASAAQAFFTLAEGFYDDVPSLRADPRVDLANVWYWRDDILANVEVPTPVFNDIMCMRCCEEALLLDPDLRPALALWLAANFRREAQLPEGVVDETRPENYPSAAYFAQSAGAAYCQMALVRAVDDNDPAVALGAIHALRRVAGPASLVTDDAGRQPLAEALSFGERMVRVQAALALGGSLPARPFHNYQNLMPVLAEALSLHAAHRTALVIDPDDASANHAAAALRAGGMHVIIDASLPGGLEKARTQAAGVDALLIASDVGEPGLRDAVARIRDDVRFASLPLVVIAKSPDREAVRDLVRADFRLGQVAAQAPPDLFVAELARVSRAVGAPPITPEAGLDLARQAAEVLRDLGLTGNALFAPAAAEPALLAALAAPDADLRVRVAEVLGFVPTRTAQQAVARVALDPAEPEALRVAMFAALASSAKRCGSLLESGDVSELIGLVEREANLTIRTAASQALGALNLPGNPASVIIRNQYGG